MSNTPIITFKAGKCELDESNRPWKVTPNPVPGYIYLYMSAEDELLHFCWRERSKPMDDPDNIDLMIFPGDCHFTPYEYKTTPQPTSKTNGRIVALKFSSSSQRHLFWLQSKPQVRNGDASTFGPRDLKITQMVDTLLQGEDVNVEEEMAQLQSGGGPGNDDEDETMEDVEGHGSGAHRGSVSGGAGADATGGDIREEGAGAREGGADGGRAASAGPTNAATVVQNFLNSLKGGQGGMQQQQQRAQGQIYTTLPDLLPSSTTIPTIDLATPQQIDNLLSYLPPTILLLAQESSAQIDGMVELNAASASAAMEALSLGQKKSILKKVLRSPQFHQSLGSLTMAIRDGGLPSIAEALGIRLQNGGLVRGGSVPLGAGEAVQAFIEGVKKTVEEQK